MFTYQLLLNWTDELESISRSAISAPPDKSFCYQAYYRVDEEAERLQAKSETTGSRKTSPEIIDVDATPAKTSTATKEDKEATSGGKKDDSSKKGWKFARQSSSNKNTKWSQKPLIKTGLAASALLIVLLYWTSSWCPCNGPFL